MHHVGHVDWALLDRPMVASPTSSGLARVVIVGPAHGAVHTEAAVGALAPGGWLGRHIHSFEEALYVLAGELILDIDGHVHRLLPGDYAHMAVGTWHALANAGREPARWFSVNTPQRLDPASGRRDTFFRDGPLDVAALAAQAVRPAFGDPICPLRRALRRDAATGRGAARRRSGPWPGAGRDGHRRSSPTAASR